MIRKLCIALFIIFKTQNLFAEGLTIAAAANIQNAISEIAGKFTEETGMKVELIIASSGKLSAQVRNGAPYDIFISADTKFPEGLYREGLSEKPVVYAVGSLVLWTMGSLKVTDGIESLVQPGAIKISLPNPDLAPYGRAAFEAISTYKDKQIIINKLVYAESVTQSNQFIQAGAVDAGFTALSSVLDPHVKKKGRYWIVKPGLYSPIQQAACILNYGTQNHLKESKLFFKYLYSRTASEIFLKYGYRSPSS